MTTSPAAKVTLTVDLRVNPASWRESFGLPAQMDSDRVLRHVTEYVRDQLEALEANVPMVVKAVRLEEEFHVAVVRPAAPQPRAQVTGMLSIAQAADYIGCNPKTIRRRIADGKLTAVRCGPRLLRVKVSDLDAIMAEVPAGGTP